MSFRSKKILTIKRVLAFIVKEVRNEKPILFVLYIARIILGILGTLQFLVLQKMIIDQIVVLLNAEENIYSYGIKVGEYILLTLFLDFIISVVQTLISSKIDIIGEYFNANWSINLNRKAMTIDYLFTESAEVLDKIEKAKEGKDWYSGGVTGILNIFFDTIQSFGTIGTVFVLILRKCPYLIPIQIIVLTIITLLNARNNKIAIETFKKQVKNNRIFNYYFFSIADYKNGKEIRIFDCKNMFVQKMVELTEKQMKHRKKFTTFSFKISAWIEIINSIKDFLSFLLVGFIFIARKLTVGDFVFCINSASSLFNNANAIVKNSQELLKRSLYAYNFVNFLEFSESKTIGTRKTKKSNHIIEFKNVSFVYPGSNEYALKNIDLILESNKTFALVGVNGSGKTTFIKLLCRLYDVTDGEILLDGIDIQEYDVDEYRKLFSCVFQDFKLFALSLKENVCLNSQYDERKLNYVLQESALSEYVKKMPLQEDTCIEKGFSNDGIELSGGQKQRTAIARVCYNNAPVLILDEPTASLDCIIEETIYNSLRTKKLNEKIKILISHRLYSCKFCERIVMFDNGRICAIGTHKELLEGNSLYRDLFFEQAKNYETNA